MNFKHALGTRKFDLPVDLSLLALRVFVGVAFMIHGSGKIRNPMGWLGPEAPVPGFFQALAALAEFGGGLALILGLLTRLASLGILVTMTVAIYMHAVVMGDPFISMTGARSYEIAAVFWLISVLLITTGGGRFSIDKKLFGPQ